mmetsp:Transcript_175699/g.558040  ORF Transcript_175699/g.558040 Transcript_175699/m.558040 type:complete len:163 (-) Transcript_175699:4712-5200(-)
MSCKRRTRSIFAAREFENLAQMFELRHAGIDDTLLAKIEAFEFEGIHELLLPLMGSRDRLRAKKLGEVISALAIRVETLVNTAGSKIHSGSDLMQSIRVLIQAGDEVGELLCMHKSMDVFGMIAGLQSRALQHLSALLNELVAALDSFDYGAVVALQGKVIA